LPILKINSLGASNRIAEKPKELYVINLYQTQCRFSVLLSWNKRTKSSRL